jgi:hypothetical protein
MEFFGGSIIRADMFEGDPAPVNTTPYQAVNRISIFNKHLT